MPAGGLQAAFSSPLELGHLLVAKLAGVCVSRFAVGFGPVLLRHRLGETEYVLSTLPLGGYVLLASRYDDRRRRARRAS